MSLNPDPIPYTYIMNPTTTKKINGFYENNNNNKQNPHKKTKTFHRTYGSDNIGKQKLSVKSFDIIENSLRKANPQNSESLNFRYTSSQRGREEITTWQMVTG